MDSPETPALPETPELPETLGATPVVSRRAPSKLSFGRYLYFGAAGVSYARRVAEEFCEPYGPALPGGQ
jgi:hypothetical protein